MQDAIVLADKIRGLSPELVSEVEDFIDFIRLRSEARSTARVMSAASAPAFDTVWNNQEDDVYDAL
jgi:hypothetical protein